MSCPPARDALRPFNTRSLPSWNYRFCVFFRGPWLSKTFTFVSKAKLKELKRRNVKYVSWYFVLSDWRLSKNTSITQDWSVRLGANFGSLTTRISLYVKSFSNLDLRLCLQLLALARKHSFCWRRLSQFWLQNGPAPRINHFSTRVGAQNCAETWTSRKYRM